eukprot:scaffold20587_cov110-Isochrysis_galbana.AAC.5
MRSSPCRGGGSAPAQQRAKPCQGAPVEFKEASVPIIGRISKREAQPPSSTNLPYVRAEDA